MTSSTDMYKDYVEYCRLMTSIAMRRAPTPPGVEDRSGRLRTKCELLQIGSCCNRSRCKWRQERLERIKSFCVAPREDSDEETVDIGVGGVPVSGRSNSHSGVCGRTGNELLTVGVAATEAERRASVASATGGAGGIPRWAEGLHRDRVFEGADIEVSDAK